MMGFQGPPARLFYDFCIDEHVPVDTGLEIGLGTRAVRCSIKSLCGPRIKRAAIAAASVSTRGPAGRYGAVLFVEKEGFKRSSKRRDFRAVRHRGNFHQRHERHGGASAHRRTLRAARPRALLLHDFDITGFSIKKTLTGRAGAIRSIRVSRASTWGSTP